MLHGGEVTGNPLWGTGNEQRDFQGFLYGMLAHCMLNFSV